MTSFWRRKQIKNARDARDRAENALTKLITDDQLCRHYEEAYKAYYEMPVTVHCAPKGWYYTQGSHGISKKMRASELMKQAQILYALKQEQDNEQQQQGTGSTGGD